MADEDAVADRTPVKMQLCDILHLRPMRTPAVISTKRVDSRFVADLAAVQIDERGEVHSRAQLGVVGYGL